LFKNYDVLNHNILLKENYRFMNSSTANLQFIHLNFSVTSRRCCNFPTNFIIFVNSIGKLLDFYANCKSKFINNSVFWVVNLSNQNSLFYCFILVRQKQNSLTYSTANINKVTFPCTSLQTEGNCLVTKIQNTCQF